MVVRGSRSDATSATASAGDAEGSTSNSSHACDDVPRAKIPVWGDAIGSSSGVGGYAGG